MRIKARRNYWMGSMQDRMRGKTLCKTSNGYVGVVPETTSVTDGVFMLNGTNLPFVLRPKIIATLVRLWTTALNHNGRLILS